MFPETRAGEKMLFVATVLEAAIAWQHNYVVIS